MTFPSGGCTCWAALQFGLPHSVCSSSPAPCPAPSVRPRSAQQTLDVQVTVHGSGQRYWRSGTSNMRYQCKQMESLKDVWHLLAASKLRSQSTAMLTYYFFDIHLCQDGVWTGLLEGHGYGNIFKWKLELVLTRTDLAVGYEWKKGNYMPYASTYSSLQMFWTHALENNRGCFPSLKPKNACGPQSCVWNPLNLLMCSVVIDVLWIQIQPRLVFCF